MNVLAIGNSFSCDGMSYVHQIARKDGSDITVINLYIGGCSLSTHYRNMLSEEKKYQIEVNGYMTGFYTSIKEALLSRDWDCITMQQASPLSPDYETYQPYLNELYAYVKKMCPKAKIGIHETWAYEKESERLIKLGYSDVVDMYNNIKKSYTKAADAINADFYIPSGTIMYKLASEGITVHRDTFHANKGIGRYALGMMWYAVLSGKDISDVDFTDTDEPVSKEHIALVKKYIKEILK